MCGGRPVKKQRLLSEIAECMPVSYICRFFISLCGSVATAGLNSGQRRCPVPVWVMQFLCGWHVEGFHLPLAPLMDTSPVILWSLVLEACSVAEIYPVLQLRLHLNSQAYPSTSSRRSKVKVCWSWRSWWSFFVHPW